MLFNVILTNNNYAMESFIKKKIPIKKITTKNLYSLADAIMNRTMLISGKKKFRICEIELYLMSDDHPDEYTHCCDDQLRYGKFYFHQYKTGTYKTGTYKGMDMTFGSEKKERYCGILIRSIYDLEEDKMIAGPCNSVKALLEQHGYVEVAEFMDGHDDAISMRKSKKNKRLYIRDKDFGSEQIYTGPRIGLKDDKYPEWRPKHYRFAIMKQIGKMKLKRSLVHFNKP